MPAIAAPNLGTNWGWDLAEDGYKAGMDFSLLLHDWLAQGYITVSAKSVSAEPGAPSNGAAYILGPSPSGTNWVTKAEDDLALYLSAWPDDDGWIFVTPLEGWRVYDRAQNVTWKFDGSGWITVPDDDRVDTKTGSTYEATLEDDVILLNNTAMSFNWPDNATVPYRIGKKLTVVNLHANSATISDDAAVTWVGSSPVGSLAQNAKIVAQKIGTEQWLRLI